ncbi:MAG: CARDB domain-containing protein, partial [Halobacteria archaeon]|nr:CARDB domain-containing protein [Halobacteria archaeon]
MLFALGTVALTLPAVAQPVDNSRDNRGIGIGTETEVGNIGQAHDANATFDTVTAEVTREYSGRFISFKLVRFEYKIDEGTRVAFSAGRRTRTEVSDGTTSQVRVGVFRFFSDMEYPLEVEASVRGGQTCSGEIPDANSSVRLCDKQPSDPANFAVTGLSTNSPVTAGETLTVDATIENTGDKSGTQNVELAVDGSTVASQSVTLAGGESQSVSFDWTTSTGDVGSHNIEVSSDDDTASTTVTVEERPAPANFNVSITGTNSPVTAGEPVNVTAEVTNTGEQQGTQTVALEDEDGFELDNREVTLSAGESQSVTLSYESAQAGTYTLNVTSDDDSDSTQVMVEEKPEPANFTVSIDSTNSPVTAGDKLLVNTTITNTGDLQDTQTVELDINGVVDSQQVTLTGGASQSVTLEWTTPDISANDNMTGTVSTANDSVGFSFTVLGQRPPFFSVSNLSPQNVTVTQGDVINVSAT